MTRIKLAHSGGESSRITAIFQQDMTEMKSGSEKLLLVAEIGGEIVGYARAGLFVAPEKNKDIWAPEGYYLLGVLVKPSFRRQGVATELTRARLTWISQRADHAWFFANAANETSVLFHKRFGFTENSRCFSYPGVSFVGGQGILFSIMLSREID